MVDVAAFANQRLPELVLETVPQDEMSASFTVAADPGDVMRDAVVDCRGATDRVQRGVGEQANRKVNDFVALNQRRAIFLRAM